MGRETYANMSKKARGTKKKKKKKSIDRNDSEASRITVNICSALSFKSDACLYISNLM